MAEIPTTFLICIAFAGGFGLGALAGAKFCMLGFIGLLRDGTLKPRDAQP